MRPVIVQVVQHLRPGGIETMALDLLQQFESKADVYIFSLEGTKEQAIEGWPRLARVQERLLFLNKQPGLQIGILFELRNKLIQYSASAVHSHHIGPLFYGGIAAKTLGLSHVHTEHDAWHLNTKSNRQLQNMLIRCLRPTLVADCEAVAAQLNHHFPFSRPQVIINGVDTKHFTPVATTEQKMHYRKILGLPASGYMIGCAARLEEVKGHEYLLKAMSQSCVDIKLVLAGSGSLRVYLEKEARKLGIDERVYFVGHLDDTLPFYRAIDLFCLPSLNEGLPLSPLEAQACGVPVIVTDVGGCNSIVCPDSGELVKAGNVQELTNALLRLHYAPAPHNPRDFVLSIGNLEKTAAAYFNLLSGSQEA